MGILSTLKNLFNKNIECEENMNNHIVFLLNKKKYLYLNKNIIVRDGTNCVVVYKSKVSDVILPGKYKITEQIIPETYRRAKIDKLNKKGKKVKKIRVDLYFVNIEQYKDFSFSSDESFMIKTKEFGRLKGQVSGLCNLRVFDSALIVKSLISETGKENNKDVFYDIGLWIGNKINKKIEKNKISLETIFNNNSYLNTILNTDLEDAYDNIGLYVNNLKVKAINFPKKYQKKLNSFLLLHKKFLTPNLIYNPKNLQPENINDSVTVHQSKINSNLNNTMQTSKNSLNLYEFKVCPKCGFKNIKSNSSCNNCGNKF